jgi:D-tagatose-1,6-bisphosphate aldolase subunit GatZ/KbaZ
MTFNLTDSIRKRARQKNIPVMDYILLRLDDLRKKTGVSRTIFAACPNSLAVIQAALRSAKRNNAPIKFAATLNQVDLDSGYTGMNHDEFVRIIKQEAKVINYSGPIIVAIDHGGPWLKDNHRTEKCSYDKTMSWIKRSFEAAIGAGYDLIHVDPTVDITLEAKDTISIAVVAERTVELIAHAEQFRRKSDLPPISYEVGTEEVHGGLANLDSFSRFLMLLKQGLSEKNLTDVWPCFVVGKVGTDLHTVEFDSEVASNLTKIASRYGIVIKGHYTDNVSNPQDYPKSGMGAANVGPEFTEREYESLVQLVKLEEKLFLQNKISKKSFLQEILWKTVIDSNRWRKWLLTEEKTKAFSDIEPKRQEWLIKTGCRYIWANSEISFARNVLYDNLIKNGIHAQNTVSMAIEKSMDKYFHAFNLINLNDYL